ncbi:hypothetical protein C2W59_03847 [Bacillus pumilus]|uniref:Uncharacterized protein n=1 Tax=Bacillus pumilus TaxID=1408 RepID=A0AB34QXF8_BACPU|nr:hypothetical protein B4127_1027 [Bacillus pumilus]RAP07335.1 hypothetical protein C2W58_01043 [Bacillus pumilus]RAP21019.1 hypothetical protein C2W59_03847 [Bacillus pumilus]
MKNQLVMRFFAFNKHLIYLLVIKFISSTNNMMTKMPIFYS